jgi:hypothetical protein
MMLAKEKKGASCASGVARAGASGGVGRVAFCDLSPTQLSDARQLKSRAALVREPGSVTN